MNSPTRRLRILMVAPANGQDVGEAWVAFQWAQQLGRLHDVTLLTYRKRRAPSVVDQLPGVRVVEWVEPPLPGLSERLNSMLKPTWPLFWLRVRRWLVVAEGRGETFDVGFQPVPVAMRYPSPLVGAAFPFVLGPVGGSLDTPPELAAGDTTPWYVGLRRVDAARLRWDPTLRRTFTSAACVLGIAPYVRDLLAGVPMRDFACMSETGLVSLPDPVDRNGRVGPVRLLFVGRVIRTKGVREAVRATALLPPGSVTLDIVGDGFDRAECTALAATLGIADRVVFHGTQPRERVDQHYRDADVFIFPSYREPGGNVVFEAMGHGLPLVVCDRGGPGNVVDDTCGFRVACESSEQMAVDVSRAVKTLVTDPQLRALMGRAARERVARIALWEAKAEEMTRLLHRVTSSTRSPEGTTTAAPNRA